MVVSFLASGSIGVVSCPPLCSFRSLEQPPLSAASPRELIYNAHLGNTKGLLSSSRFNAFSPKSPRCPFYTLFRRRLSPSVLFSFLVRPMCSLFYAGDFAILFHLLFALHRFFAALNRIARRAIVVS